MKYVYVLMYVDEEDNEVRLATDVPEIYATNDYPGDLCDGCFLMPVPVRDRDC